MFVFYALCPVYYSDKDEERTIVIDSTVQVNSACIQVDIYFPDIEQ